MTDPSETAFILTYDVAQLPDDSEVAFQLMQPETLNPEDLWTRQEATTFFSFTEPFDGVDYPLNDQDITIMSKNAFGMIEQLDPNHGCEVARIEVINTILDPAGDPRENLVEVADLIAASRTNPSYFSDRFLAIRPPVLVGIFDKQRSRFSVESDGRIGVIEEYVLVPREGRLPPLFMIPEHLGKVFVTSSLRRAWQRGKIGGVAYYSLKSPWTGVIIDDYGQPIA